MRFIQHQFRRGFTLIELLVVIAVMGVIASAVLVAIDPIDKIRAANDSRVQADIGQMATALTAYATSHTGQYPCTVAAVGCPNTPASGEGDGLDALVGSGELTKKPAAPSGYTAYAYVGTAASAKVYGEVKSKKFTNVSNPRYWGWCNTSGSAADVAVNDGSACPP